MIFLLLVTGYVYGQYNGDYIIPCFHCNAIPKKDWGIISQGTIMLKVSPKVKGELNFQTRIMDNAQQLKTIMVEPGIKLKLSNHFAIKSALRYSSLPIYRYDRIEFYNKIYRLHLAGYYVWHKEGVPLRIQIRVRTEGENSSSYWRYRLKIASNYKGFIKPYSSFEIFNRSKTDIFLDVYRVEAGVKTDLNESLNITCMYRHESYYWHYNKSRTDAIGIMINLSI